MHNNIGTACRFAANGWPINTQVKGLGMYLKQLIMAAAHTDSQDAAKMQGGLLDVYAALQTVPPLPGSSSSDPGSFGDSPEATPEATNPFGSGSSAQSSGFSAAPSPAPAATAAPLSAAQQAVSSAVQTAAAVTVNATRNTTSTVFGVTQPVVLATGAAAYAPAEAPAPAMDVDTFVIEAGQPVAAPVAAIGSASGFVGQGVPMGAVRPGQ